MSVGIEQWSGGMATGHWNRRLDGAEQWSWGSDVAATDGDRNVDGFWCRLGHWTLVLLGALIGYRCSLGRCRGLVLVGPLEVLVLTGHGCRNSTGVSARSRMQGSHTAPGFLCQ